MNRPINIIIPTFNNPEYLIPCVHSIAKTGILQDLATLTIVNNGKQDIETDLGPHPAITILNPGENLGWEGGLALGLKSSDAPFVVFQNDDTFIPSSNAHFYQNLLIPFANQNVSAVGPITTTAAGLQSIYHHASPQIKTEASFLIFFAVMVRRAHLDEVGGVDTTLPGGDDFDLSIRFRKAGHTILINPAAFIIHHGFKTGVRVRGDHTMKGGWNSIEMSDRTNQYLIRKHGFKTFFNTIRGLQYKSEVAPDLEADAVRGYIGTGENVLELGCGGRKTVEHAVGVDLIPNGEPIPHVPDFKSVADVVADVTQSLPFLPASQDGIIARHILEHCIDPVKTLKEWRRVLRPNGKVVVAVPDETITRGIPLNFEHVHAFTPDSLKSIMETVGFAEVESKSAGNGVSFVACYQREN